MKPSLLLQGTSILRVLCGEEGCACAWRKEGGTRKRFGGVCVEITFRPPWWKSCFHRAEATTQRKLPTRIQKHTLPHTLTQHHPTLEPYHVHFQRTFKSPRPHRVHNARAPHVHRASTMVVGGTIQWMRTANSEQEARWEQDGFHSTVQTLGINDPMRVGC